MKPPPIPVAIPSDHRPSLDPLPPPPHRSTTVLGAIGWVLALAGVEGVCGFGIAVLGAHLSGSGVPLRWLSATNPLVVIGFCIVGLRLKYGTAAHHLLALRRPRMVHLVLVILLAFPLFLLCAELANVLDQVFAKPARPSLSLKTAFPFPPDSDSDAWARRFDRLIDLDYQSSLPLALVLAALLPAISEELFFRGLLGRGLVARYGTWYGVFVTALLFGLLHGEMVRILTALFFGLIVHVVYIATRSLVSAIVLHTVHNSLTIVAYKCMAQFNVNLTCTGATGHVPPWAAAAAAVGAACILYAILRSRSQWIYPDGTAWSPGYASAELPPATLGTLVRDRPLGRTVAVFVVASFTAFAATSAVAGRSATLDMIATLAWSRADALYQRGEYAAAAAAYADGIEAKPDDSTGYLGRGLASLMAGDAKGALEDLDRAVALDPRSAVNYLSRSNAYAALGRHDEAAADFARLGQLAPLASSVRGQWANYNRERAENAILDAKYALALTELDRAAVLNPIDTDTLRLRGFVHQTRGDADRAIADYSELLRLLPKDAYALGNRGLCRLDRGEMAAALTDLSMAIDLEPGSPDHRLGRGRVYHRKGDLDLAMADLTTAVRLDAQSSWGRVARGRVQYDRGALQDAVHDFSAALDIDPTNTPARFDRGRTYFRQREFEKAVIDFDAVATARPSDAFIHSTLANLLATCPVESVRDGRRAVSHATKANELSKYSNPAFLETLAAAYALVGEFDNAVKWQAKAVDIGYQDPRSSSAARERLMYYEGK